MKRIGLLITLFAAMILVLPSLTAQDDKKKDADQGEKKEEAKKDTKDPDKKDLKDPEKKDEKRDSEKKDDDKKKPAAKAEKKPIEKMPSYANMIRTKILSANGESRREFTIELQEVDPKKVLDLENWKAQQSVSLAQQQFNLARISPKDVQGKINASVNYKRALAQYQIDLAKRSTQIYSSKPLEVRAHEDAKVRTKFLPIQFDDQGFQKKWTKKEQDEFRGYTEIPGFPSDFEAIKSGQIVEIYMARKPAPAKDAPKKKKGPDDDPVVEMRTPEFILIVIVQEGKQ
jgi:FtsZ-interacting cell division protein ZipA